MGKTYRGIDKKQRDWLKQKRQQRNKRRLPPPPKKEDNGKTRETRDIYDYGVDDF